MKTVEMIRGTFEGRYHAGDQVAVSDQVADILVAEKFARIVESEDENGIDLATLLSTEAIMAMNTKKELEAYAARIGMLSLDGSMKIKDMQNAILNYQDECIAKSTEM